MATATDTRTDTTTGADRTYAPAGEMVATVPGDELARAFRRLRQVGKARPVTIYRGGAGLILAVRVTAARDSDGVVAVTVPCDGPHGDPDALPLVLAGGVLGLDIAEDRPYAIRGGAGTSGAMIGEWAIATAPLVGYNPREGKAAVIPFDLDPFRVSGGAVLPAGAFANAAARVIPAAAPSREVRKALTGIHFVPNADAGSVELVATDSYRLHAATCPVREGAEYLGTPGSSTDPTTLLPAAFVARLVREAGRKGWGKGVRIARAYRAGHPWTVVKGGDGTVLLVSNIAAQAPDAGTLFDRFEPGLPFALPQGTAIAALDSLEDRAKLATGGARGGTVVMEHGGDGFTLSREVPGREDPFTVTINAAWGATFERTGYNAAFLRDFLAAVPMGGSGPDRIALTTNGTTAPLTVVAPGYRALLMPIRLPR